MTTRSRGARGLRRSDSIAPRLRWGAPRVGLIDAADAVAISDHIRTEIQRRETLLRRALGLADVIAVAGAFVAATLWAGGDEPKLWALALLPLVVVVSKTFGLYDRDPAVMGGSTLDEVPRVAEVATAVAFAVFLFGPGIVASAVDKPTLVAFWLILVAAMVVGRGVARAVTRSVLPPERCLVIGNPALGEQVRGRLADSPSLNAEVVEDRRSVGPWSGRDRRVGEQLRWSQPRLVALLARTRIHRVILAPDSVDSEEVLELVRAADSLGVKVSVASRSLEVMGMAFEFEEVRGVPLLSLREFELSRSSRFLKRGFDLLTASVALVLLAPFFAMAALAIKLDSPGPVFFRQRRVGSGGANFEIIKFRTMVEDAEARKAGLARLNEVEAMGFFKIDDDPRITRVGKLLRRTSLDELPQLLNVLRGEMSLVGPRPLIHEEDAKIIGWDRSRLNLRPGVTGPWQVLGSSRVPLRDMVKIDHLYAANWSIWCDVKLLIRTISYVAAHRGL